jgi:hypothetical protein
MKAVAKCWSQQDAVYKLEPIVIKTAHFILLQLITLKQYSRVSHYSHFNQASVYFTRHFIIVFQCRRDG